MIAWGTKITKGTEEKILEKLNKIKNLNIFAYAWNDNSNCPYHPATRVDNKKSNYPLTNILLNKKIVKLKIEDKYTLKKKFQ